VSLFILVPSLFSRLFRCFFSLSLSFSFFLSLSLSLSLILRFSFCTTIHFPTRPFNSLLTIPWLPQTVPSQVSVEHITHKHVARGVCDCQWEPSCQQCSLRRDTTRPNHGDFTMFNADSITVIRCVQIVNSYRSRIPNVDWAVRALHTSQSTSLQFYHDNISTRLP
jgi:hypothetical protein